MKKFLLFVLGLILVFVLLSGVYAASLYNRLVSSNEAIDNQWAQVETQYQRRYDLIPNLVSSVKGVMAQEERIFGALAEARTRYSGAVSVEDRIKATNQVEAELGRLLVVMENYPELKSSETVQTLMIQLEGTENRISVERKKYNEAVQEFNVKIKSFPDNLIARMFTFAERSYFESVSGAESVPKVEF
ncbi:MAG: LemA family protein [bacterium]